MDSTMKSVTQKLDYGCGVACFAFICGMSFEDATAFLGKEYSVKHEWRPNDLAVALNRFGLSYKNHYVRRKAISEYPQGPIVLIERSANYPVGHYLTLSTQGWMDPWINLPDTKDLHQAKSGFREQLPGKPMYAIIPTSS